MIRTSNGSQAVLSRIKAVNKVKVKLGYVVGLMVAMVVGGATSAAVLASIPDSSGVIHGCYSNNFGLLRVIDNSTDNCKSGEVGLNWNQTGPQGPAGPAGPQGPAGPAGSSVGYLVTDVSGTSGQLAYNVIDSSNVSASSLNPTQNVYCVTVNTPQLHGAVISPETSDLDDSMTSGSSWSYTVLGRSNFDVTVCPVGTNFEFRFLAGNGEDMGNLDFLFY